METRSVDRLVGRRGRMSSLLEKFESRIEPCPMTGCWLWTGPATEGKWQTRGWFYLPGGKGRQASRASWALYRGPVPDGAHVLHYCDVPLCVNPAHLWLGDHRANMLDMKQKCRARTCDQTKTHCRRGHPLEGDNVYVYPSGKRACRICHRAASNTRMKAKRAAARALLHDKEKT